MEAVSAVRRSKEGVKQVPLKWHKFMRQQGLFLTLARMEEMVYLTYTARFQEQHRSSQRVWDHTASQSPYSPNQSGWQRAITLPTTKEGTHTGDPGVCMCSSNVKGIKHTPEHPS